MKLLPYVLCIIAGLNFLYGVPILTTGRVGIVDKAMPQLREKLSLEALQVYGLMFGTLAFVLGAVRFLCGFALVQKPATSREIYVAMMSTFVVEMARDIQLARAGVVHMNESISILMNAALFGWAAATFKMYTVK